MLVSKLSLYLQKLESVSSRIEITKILAELFRNVNSEEIGNTVYLILGTLAPQYKNIVFNIADQLVLKSIAQAFNIDLAKVKEVYKKEGDIGVTAQKFATLTKVKSKGDILVNDVYQKLL